MDDRLEANKPTPQMQSRPPFLAIGLLLFAASLLYWTFREPAVDHGNYGNGERAVAETSSRRERPAPVKDEDIPPEMANRGSLQPALPRGNAAMWVMPDDYPARALREESQGTSRITVTVGANGRVEDCKIVESSGHAVLDDAACEAIEKRARFYPATDDNGQPTQGEWSRSVRWQIPQG